MPERAVSGGAGKCAAAAAGAGERRRHARASTGGGRIHQAAEHNRSLEAGPGGRPQGARVPAAA